jgi:hypothetical protein
VTRDQYETATRMNGGNLEEMRPPATTGTHQHIFTQERAPAPDKRKKNRSRAFSKRGVPAVSKIGGPTRT